MENMTEMILMRVNSSSKNILGAYICWALFFVIMVQLKRKSYPATDQLDKFLESLNLKSDHVVYPVTMRLGADICARTGCETFWWQPGGITCPAQYTKFIEEYPYLKREWKPLAKEFGVTHIICEKSAIRAIDWAYDFSSSKTMKENERYVAYAV